MISKEKDFQEFFPVWNKLTAGQQEQPVFQNTAVGPAYTDIHAVRQRGQGHAGECGKPVFLSGHHYYFLYADVGPDGYITGCFDIQGAGKLSRMCLGCQFGLTDVPHLRRLFESAVGEQVFPAVRSAGEQNITYQRQNGLVHKVRS